MQHFTSETNATIEIHEWVRENIIRNRTDSDANRASAAPQCVRKRWYRNHGFKGEELQPRMSLVFMLGDLVEHAMKYLIKQANVGPDKLYKEVDFGEKVGEFPAQGRAFDIYRQEGLSIKIDGSDDVSGHPDGWGLRNSDSKWEVIEVKSSADIGYDRFARGETPDYIKQVHAIMMSSRAKELGADSARFFYWNKNTSHICDRLYQYNPAIAYEVAQEYKVAAGSEIPNRPYSGVYEMFRTKPTGRTILPWQCSYCDLVTECQTEFKRVIEKGKPIYVKEA